MKSNVILLLVLGGLLSLLSPRAGRAQMFSVRSLPQQYTVPSSNIFFGVLPTRFHFKPSNTNAVTDPGEFNFTDPVYQLGLDLAGLELSGKAGWNLGAARNLNFYELGMAFKARYPVLQSKPLLLSLPLVFHVRWTRVENKNAPSNTDFRQNTGTIGSGLNMEVRLPDQVRLLLEGTLHYGFSVRALGQSSGSAWSGEVRSRLFFDRLIEQLGLSLGVDYRYTRFNNGETRYDYGMKNLSFLVGVTF
jgi:hypothetical protein